MNSRQRAAWGRKQYWSHVSSPGYREHQKQQRERSIYIQEIYLDTLEVLGPLDLDLLREAHDWYGKSADWPVSDDHEGRKVETS